MEVLSTLDSSSKLYTLFCIRYHSLSLSLSRNDQRMALVQMGSAEEALSALIGTHNHKASDTNHLRVTFSKSNI